MNNYSEQTLGQIVTQQHKAAFIFEKYNLDFCCKGKRSLVAACSEKGIPVENIIDELNTQAVGNTENMPFQKMSATELIAYILEYHHFYVKEYGPTIKQHLDKVAFKHGERFPWMTEVATDYTALLNELLLHMQKEEIMLFPRIERMEKNEKGTYPPNFIAAPIGVMEADHEVAGQYMEHIKELTNNYTSPETACNTFRVSMLELKEFEENLHQHVHLENNILFPKALAF
ncbi:iron-sulfur cluster repair di-iron protein [Ginsengibacter hankyongi]|uniref:Iron-sulfur cluster repair di-iron protein n=1 Tax=Ginsengibacter hankyongi TaxID=2607284 RepID=A0A5J5IF56_9BACT|nr:iron-sulfur cluster repair di-iron protein [Ginsengibacter hankyongi]KAA9038148.1 iron-sulfur cluster repair di-iron protein [Ginsengibacter hankyongi]